MWSFSTCGPRQNIKLFVYVPLLLAAMVRLIIGTQNTPGLHFLYGSSNCELAFSVSIVIVLSIENRCVMSPSLHCQDSFWLCLFLPARPRCTTVDLGLVPLCEKLQLS